MPNSLKAIIIEDEIGIRKFLKNLFAANNIATIEASNARDAINQIIGNMPDFIILDLGLPDKDGQDIIIELREWCKIPIIVLSARDDEREKVRALENGADDYLTKPFSTNELMARIKVALRHVSQSKNDLSPIFEYERLKIDFSSRKVSLNGNELKLTPIEYKLLCCLAKHAGKVITHSQLMNAIWGKRAADNNSYLRIHTQHLREKLNDDPMNPKYIITIPSVGYRLNF